MSTEFWLIMLVALVALLIFGWDSAHSKLQRMYGAEIRQLYAQQI